MCSGSPLHYSFAFAANAAGIVIVNTVNARIVGRFGQRRLLHLGIGLLVLFSALLLVDALLGPVLWASLALLWGRGREPRPGRRQRDVSWHSTRFAMRPAPALRSWVPCSSAWPRSYRRSWGSAGTTALPMAVAMVISSGIGAAALLLTRERRAVAVD